jgi:hypothetical protein
MLISRVSDGYGKGATRVAAILAILAIVALGARPVRAQGQSPKATAKPAKTWTPTKTPWGDPDIQGVWTSDSVRGIPTQRPAELAGKAELSEDEYNKKVARDEQTRKTAENAEGAFRNDGAWLLKSFRQTSLITEPADGRFPPLTPEAQRRAAPRDRGSFGEGPFYSPEDFTLYDRCITRGIIGSILPVVYGNGNRILQTPGQVVISYEMVHDTRVIPIDGRPHLSSKIRQYLGDSRGHWEGNTLVVETTNLTDQTSIGANGNGLRHSAEMKMIERFTRLDSDVLQYEITVDDPKTYSRPFKMSIPLISPPGFALLPYECHEGNYMLQNVLSGERAEDKALEEDARKGIIRPRKGVQQGLDAGARPLPGTQGGEGGPGGR